MVAFVKRTTVPCVLRCVVVREPIRDVLSCYGKDDSRGQTGLYRLRNVPSSTNAFVTYRRVDYFGSRLSVKRDYRILAEAHFVH